MKKFLSLLLAVLMLVSFASCGAKNGKPANDNEAVEQVVEKFNEALCKLDTKKAFKYVDEDSDIYLDTPNLDFDAFAEIALENFPAELKSDELNDVLEDFVDDLVKVITSEMSAEIKDIEVDGDTATVEVEVRIPVVEDISIEDYLDEDAVMESFAETISEKEMEKMLTMDEEEGMEFLVSKMPDIMEAICDEILNFVEDDLEVEESTQTYTLNKIDDEWLIVEID